MDMKFRDVLPGKARRTGKEDDQAAVEHGSIRRSEPAQNRRPVLNHATGNRFDYESSLPTGDTQHGDTGRKPTARQRNDRIA
ncbi:hypothetical protein MesoLj131c_08670 [Mesorhizobium sp. 131-3-5]|nr:hypothetical protein MesoLj131c_08670 [Mesorhizobium sp. 131-3-5]